MMITPAAFCKTSPQNESLRKWRQTIFTWYISRESPLCYSLVLPFESETFKVLKPVRPDPRHLDFHDTFPHCYGSHVWIISSVVHADLVPWNIFVAFSHK